MGGGRRGGGEVGEGGGEVGEGGGGGRRGGKNNKSNITNITGLLLTTVHTTMAHGHHTDCVNREGSTANFQLLFKPTYTPSSITSIRYLLQV